MTTEHSQHPETINVHDSLTLILGKSGTGKTYLTRLQALRMLRQCVSS